ncbi:MAG TPA: hypothetical protein IAB23_01965 [Candidatus Scybalocola faecavium]|nr:hypothetical protein [Candidatus Scybalocola faecavium]
MEGKAWQVKKICCNIIAWFLIWLIAVLAVPAGLLMLLIFQVKGLADRVIRRIDGSRWGRNNENPVDKK